MTKKSVLLRQKRRARLVPQYADKRAALKRLIRDRNVPMEQKMEAVRALCKLPRDSSGSRLRNRCRITGRARGNYRRFGISRIMLRRLAHWGELPGVRKASW
ncbi:MAG: 30S ribosomal protein S14 [Planctomycetota bacterium]|nr:MAG: 30S ribosomal protein S14 [Planctomycetota bacterium]